MGAHNSVWSSSTRIGHPLAYNSRGHLNKWVATNRGGLPSFLGVHFLHMDTRQQGLGFQLGWHWAYIVDGCGLPTWANMAAQHGWIWASNMGKHGRPTWMDVDFQYGQTWPPDMDGYGLPIWANMAARHGWMWASKFGQVWSSIIGRIWTPSTDVFWVSDCSHYRASNHAHYWASILRIHHGCPLLGCHFMGVHTRPITGAHAPPLWA